MIRQSSWVRNLARKAATLPEGTKLLALAVVIALLGLSLPSWSEVQLVETTQKEVTGATGETITIALLQLRLDDKLRVTASMVCGLVPVAIEINFLGRLIVSSAAETSPTLEWEVNGDATYSIEATVDSNPAGQRVTVSVVYSVLRPIYPLFWLNPIMFLTSLILSFAALSRKDWQFRRPAFTAPSLARSSSRVPFLSSDRVLRTLHAHREVLAIFVLSLSLGLILTNAIVHNDEKGGNRTDWGYFAWGYVDTSEQIANLIKNGQYAYEDWFAVQNNAKPILPTLLMAVGVLAFPFLTPVEASRLVAISLGALGTAALYVLVRRMINRMTGLLAIGFLLFSPIFLNYRSTAYLDIPFLALATIFLYCTYRVWHNGSNRWIFACGIAAGVAMASKSVAFLWVLLAINFLWLALSGKFPVRASPRNWISLLATVSLIGILALSTFVLLWPLTWTNPLKRLVSFGLFGAGFGIGLEPSQFPLPPDLWFGTVQRVHPVVAPWFYIVYQTTYLELVGFALGIGVLILGLKKRAIRREELAWFAAFGVLLFATILVGSLLQHRVLYLLVAYDVIAALGIAGVIPGLVARIHSRRRVDHQPRAPNRLKRVFAASLVLAIVLPHAALAFQAAPYYGLYRNEAFLLGARFEDWFSLPEPIYGLHEAAVMLRSINESGSTVLATEAPHILQLYLPGWTVLSLNQVGIQNTTTALSQLKTSGVAYILISMSWLQVNRNSVLVTMLELEGQAASKIFTVSRAGINLVEAYALRVGASLATDNQ